MFRLSALHDIAYLMNDTSRCSMTKQIKKSRIAILPVITLLFVLPKKRSLNVLCILNDWELSYAVFES